MKGEDIREFVERMKHLSAREIEELRATPPSKKLEQLAALMLSARLLDWQTTDPEEIDLVRRRWIHLKEKLGG